MRPDATRRKKKMDIKEYLRGVRKLSNNIESMKRMRERLKYELLGHGIPIKQTFVQESTPIDKMASTMASVTDLEKEIEKRIRVLAKEQAEALAIIQTLKKPEYRAILIDYYLNDYTWEEVANLHGYAPKYVERLHGLALNELRESGY